MHADTSPPSSCLASVVRSSSVRAWRLLSVIALLCFCFTQRLAAWTPETQKLIAIEAAKLSPPDLFHLIDRHEDRFLDGVVAPFREGDPSRHYKNLDGSGLLDRVIAEEAQRAIDYIEGHQPFPEIARQLGVLAYFMASANNPLNTSSEDQWESQYFKDYASYVESARARLPVIFYGSDSLLDAGDVDGFVSRVLARGRLLYPSIGIEYRRIGKLPGSQYFDDRSTAFGVTSVAFSRAVSDVALMLRYVWITAGGLDQRDTPAESEGRLLVVRGREMTPEEAQGLGLPPN